MKINIIYNKNIPNYKEQLTKVEEELKKYNTEFKSFDIDEMQYYGDFTITLGGDGTILRTARFYSAKKIPVLGINMGRLGFLSQSEKIQTIIKAVVRGEYHTEERIMLRSSDYLALNDFVVRGCNSSRASNFYLKINGHQVCDYIADGLIISTPTGSTAYGLSAGGPVVYPTLDAIVIVPICPHTLNARPLVVPITEKPVIKTNDGLLSVAIDGYDKIECTDKIEISVSEQKAVLAFLKKRQFYSVLRNKLHWGVSPEA
ncbi:MAG: NAD(+)/NADH kinase [bacterium]|nr:NAD(+)/NADH kinase [bacterium]